MADEPTRSRDAQHAARSAKASPSRPRWTRRSSSRSSTACGTRRYQKTVQRTKRFYAHDETNDVREGDRVRIAETRPMSKQKRWRIVEVLERAR